MHDLVAAYALDALDQDETVRFEDHLRTCARCREELVALSESAADVAATVAVPPPPRVREAVLQATQGASLASVTRLDLGRNIGWVVAGVAAVIALMFVGLWATATDELRNAERVAAVYEAPDATVVELEGSHGQARLVYSLSLGEAVLNGARLAEIDATDVYEMWLIDSDGAVAAGTFAPGDAAVHIGGIMTDTTFAVTVEEAPGVDQPSGDPVLATEL